MAGWAWPMWRRWPTPMTGISGSGWTNWRSVPETGPASPWWRWAATAGGSSVRLRTSTCSSFLAGRPRTAPRNWPDPFFSRCGTWAWTLGMAPVPSPNVWIWPGPIRRCSLPCLIYALSPVTRRWRKVWPPVSTGMFSQRPPPNSCTGWRLGMPIGCGPTAMPEPCSNPISKTVWAGCGTGIRSAG